jgi:glycine dehydrogenase
VSLNQNLFLWRIVFPQTIKVIKTRAKPLGIEVIVDDPKNVFEYDIFASLIQYPGGEGTLLTKLPIKN